MALLKVDNVTYKYKNSENAAVKSVSCEFEPEKIYMLANKAFAGDFDSETVLKWLKVFYRRFFTQQFKRNCVPDGIKLGSVGVSPKNEWVMPSDAAGTIWLKKIEKIK